MPRSTYFDPPMSNPTLKAAMKEIDAVLKKHDLAGFVLISTPSDMEYMYAFQPTWSCARLDGNRLEIRAKREQYLTEKDYADTIAATTGIFMSFGTACARAIGDFEQITAAIAQQVGPRASISHFTRSENPEPPEKT